MSLREEIEPFVPGTQPVLVRTILPIVQDRGVKGRRMK
jgi:hypothetical protein